MKKIFKIFGAVLASALFFAGCSDLNSSSDSTSSSASSSKAYVKIVDKASSSKTAIPADFVLSDFDYFNLYYVKDVASSDSWDAALTAAGKTKDGCLKNEKVMGSDELSSLIEFAAGEYWFRLEAGNNKDLDELKFVGTLQTEIEAGENAISFDLYPEEYGTSGKGTVDITVSFPALVKKVTLKIAEYTVASGAGTWTSPTTATQEWTSSSSKYPITDNSVNYVDEKAGSGIYVYEFDFFNTEDVSALSLKTYRELVIVADGKTSKSSFTIDSLKVEIDRRVKNAADTVGDIVLSDGRAIAYDSSITKADLDKFLSDEGLDAVGVVYYTGYSDSKNPTENEETLGDRILCVSVDSTTAEDPFSQSVYSMKKLAWSTEDGNGYKTNIQDVAVCGHTDSSTVYEKADGQYIASNGGTNSTIFAGWYTDTDKKNWVEPLFDGTNAKKILTNAAADTPAGNSIDEATLPAFEEIDGDTAVGTDKVANSRNYLPSVIELLELCSVKDTVNKSLALVVDNVWDVLGGTEDTFHKERYWSCSQCATSNTLAWSVGFYGDNNVGVPMASPKTDEYSVVGIFQYNVQ